MPTSAITLHILARRFLEQASHFPDAPACLRDAFLSSPSQEVRYGHQVYLNVLKSLLHFFQLMRLYDGDNVFHDGLPKKGNNGARRDIECKMLIILMNADGVCSCGGKKREQNCPVKFLPLL